MTLEQLNIISQYAEKKVSFYRQMIKEIYACRPCRPETELSLEELIERRDYFKAVLNNVNEQIEEFIKLTVIL